MSGDALKVEQWPIDRLVEYARNPRKNDEHVDRMVAAIREFGFRIPIVAKSDGLVVDGHLRLKAARKMGLADVPVALADSLTEAQIKAFRLLANQSANWAGWDADLLALELGDLGSAGFDLSLIGFSDDELRAWLEQPLPLSGMPGLPDGDKPEFQQMTFTLHDDQAEAVKAALEAAKDQGPFDGPNENSNGNALARICEAFSAHA